MNLLVAGDPAPVAVQNAGGGAPFLIVCDHAGRRVPRALGDLGLPPVAFERHIAWDIGAGALSERLGVALDATVVRQAYSRLVIDCNRAPDRPDLVVQVSDGTPVPGNAGMRSEAVRARLDAIHRPYHAAIAAALDRLEARGPPPALVLIHSFTPRLETAASPERRPWHMGVLHLGDSTLSKAVLSLLQAEDGLVVGDNEPYAMDSIDYTAPHHAGGRGLDYLELEVRQDLIADEAGQARMAERLARLLPQCLQTPRP